MIERLAPPVATALAAVLGFSGLLFALGESGQSLVGPRLSDPAEAAVSASPPRANLRGELASFGAKARMDPSSWPRFRGASFDNVAVGPLGLADSWPPEGPQALWSVELGEGHAGPAVSEGRVFVTDYDETRQGDSLRCFSLSDGAEIWRRFYAVKVKRNHGMSRTVPAVSDGAVVSIGPMCHVICVDAASGDFRWGLDLAADFKAEVPMWYAGQCPLIDSGEAVIAPGGCELMIGVDLASGSVKWRAPNPGGWKMSHSSIVPMTLGGRRVFVYCAVGGVAGISAEPPHRGSILWKTDAWSHAVTAPSPVQIGPDRVLVTAGYGAGSAVIRIDRRSGGLEAGIESVHDKSVFACEQHTPVVLGDRVFTVMPADAGALKRQLVCADLSLRPLWSSGPENRFGLGPFMVVDDRLLVLRDDGWLFMASAGAAGYRELARAKVLPGRDAWAPMAVAGTRLLLRDWKKMVCLQLERR